MMGVSLYCNVDEEGKLIESLIGERIIPMKQYDYFFFITDLTVDEITKNIPKYIVIERELVLE